jgi:hypothetical protein
MREGKDFCDLIDSAKLLTTKAGMAKTADTADSSHILSSTKFCPSKYKHACPSSTRSSLARFAFTGVQQRPVAVLNLFCRQEPLHRHQGRESLEDQGDAGDRFLQCAENSAPVKSSTGTRKQSPNGKPPAHNTLHQEMITLRQTLKTAPAPRMA